MADLGPVERAVRVLDKNSFFVLATTDEDGPWAAALAYTPFPPNQLCFISRTWSRHGRAIDAGGPVAGVIFDSAAAPEDVESIQFAGVARRLERTHDEVRRILDRSAQRGGGASPSNEDISRVVDDEEAGLYCIEIENAFVLDQQAWLDRGVDAREPVDVRAVFERGR